MESWLSYVSGIISSVMVIIGFVCFAVRPIRERILRKVNGDRNQNKGLCVLLRTNIIHECKKAKAQGFLCFYDNENLQDAFDCYQALGGNHGIEKLVHETLTLPVNMGDIDCEVRND